MTEDVLHYTRESGESWGEYQHRLIAELGAYRGSPGYSAVMDVVRAEMMQCWYAMLSAQSADDCWEKNIEHRAVKRLYDVLVRKSEERERLEDAERRQELDEYPDLQNINRRRRAALTRPKQVPAGRRT